MINNFNMEGFSIIENNRRQQYTDFIIQTTKTWNWIELVYELGIKEAMDTIKFIFDSRYIFGVTDEVEIPSTFIFETVTIDSQEF